MLKTPTNKQFKTVSDLFRSIPHRYYFAGAALFVIVIVTALFWPRHVTLSYASAKTCFYQPTLAPGLLRSKGDQFKLEAEGTVVIAGVTIAAMNMCVVPLRAPSEGSASSGLSFMGSWIGKTYTVTVPAPPSLVRALPKLPLPISRPVTLQLNGRDAVFTYKATVGKTTVPCTVAGKELACELRKLGLGQGKEYMIQVDRYFGAQKKGTLLSQAIATLKATTVTASSVAQGETVYSKPRSIKLSVDKVVADARLRLYKIDGQARDEIQTTAVLSGNTLTLNWTSDLPRKASYEMVAEQVTGNDGSGLDGEYTLRFALSGGPAVKNISVGANRVAVGTQATLEFDQPIAGSQDISQVVTVTGGASVTGKKGSQVFISFTGVPRCGDVTIKVTDGIRSNYDIAGGSAWQYTTRTLCQAQESIGTSVKGRPLTAYSFGSGSNSIVFTGAIHGSEASTRSLMLRWIDELETNARSIPADKKVIVIPSLNPDGVAAGNRTNANNVDLNRNFATADWKSDITTTSNAAFLGGGGSSALSEPESRAIANYIGRMRPRLVLSYHSIGGLLAANQAGDSSAQAATYAGISGYRNTTGSSDTFEYGISGTADDYYAEAFGIPSLLIELGSHTDPQFGRNQKAMWAMVK